jgi:hypothetical protein
MASQIANYSYEPLRSKCERKVVRKFALQSENLMHSLCPRDRANKSGWSRMTMFGLAWLHRWLQGGSKAAETGVEYGDHVWVAVSWA